MRKDLKQATDLRLASVQISFGSYNLKISHYEVNSNKTDNYRFPK